MDQGQDSQDTFSQEDHQVAYIFDPDQDENTRHQRPSKRRRVAKGPKKGAKTADEPPLFVPLFNGAEKTDFVKLRQRKFEESWGLIDQRIQNILRESNSATLEEVTKFVASAETECAGQIPSAFVITGPNIASQDLLFQQLSESLQQSVGGKFVRLKSSEAVTLKAALKKTIREAMASVGDEENDDLQVGNSQDTRRYLDYDLEALEVYIRPLKCEHVFVAFQDSEGFDSSLLSDLITLFHSWRPQIPFTLLFGIATSVELLQTRLLKSACRLIYGGQFDGVQTASILEAVFRGAVAAADVPLRLGAPLLRSMLDRQHEQVAGIQSFISSLKYAYMCHFYANPLSVLCFSDEDTEVLQREHLEAVRNLWSFRHTVEAEVEKSTLASLEHAKSLIEDNEYLLSHVRTGYRDRQAWTDRFLRSLLIMQAAGMQRACFSKVYVDSMVEGAQLSSAQSGLTQSIRRMGPDELSGLLHRVIAILNTGDSLLNLGPCVDERDIRLHTSLESKLEELKQLQAHAQEGGMALRSKYSGHSKVMRTTVIAQKVQLSQDSAALSDQDNRLTEMIDEVTSLLSSHYPDTNPNTVLLAECWLYETKSPSREVFVPRPWVAFERSLGRPHDYLNCSCCRPDSQGLQATLPPTSILYQMYLETGSLINVADLWAAFYALVQGEEDERKALMLFYRGLAEMRALGFVKSSKKKADHIAKVKWL